MAHIFQIFNALCEHNEDGGILTPLRIDIEETERIGSEICHSVGIRPKHPSVDNHRISYSEGTFLLDFSEFVSLLAERIGSEEDAEVIDHGISEVSSQVNSDVIRKVT